MTDLLTRTQRATRLPGPAAAVAGLGVLSVALALLAATRVDDVDNLGDMGLAPALPVGFWVAVVGLNLAFVLSLVAGRGAPRLERWSAPWLSPGLLAGLVLIVYGLGPAVSDVPRNAVAWRHLGIADAIGRGTFDPNIDVYFNWSGFFNLLATLTGATGVDPVDLARWAPLVNIALWSLAVLALLRIFTRDRTTLLLALWLFLAGNWIDQDYMSPQALGVLFHLTVLALALSFLGARSSDPTQSLAGGEALVPEHADGARRRTAFAVALLLCAALVASHQLTPVLLVVSLAALVLVRRLWTPLLPVVLGLFLVLWLLYPASTYLNGHPPFGDAGQPGLLEANLGQRLAGSPGHMAVQNLRIGLTVALWTLAGIGAVRGWRAGRRDPRPYVLLVAPFVVLPTQSYGGEMLLRVTLFALPMVALFAAQTLLPLTRAAGLSRVTRPLALSVVLSALVATSVLARYGNARFDMFTDAEVAAVAELDDLAPPDSVIVAGASSTPWASEDYATYTRRSVQSLCARGFGAQDCAETLRSLANDQIEHGGITLLLTRGNEASLESQGFMSEGGFDDFESALRGMPGSALVFSNEDARIYHLDAFSSTEPSSRSAR